MMNKIIEELKGCFLNNKLLFVFSIGIYFFGFILSFVIFYFAEIPDPSELKELCPVCPSAQMCFESIPTVFDIIERNILVMLIMLSGSFLLGLTTFICLFFNGAVLGSVISGLAYHLNVPITEILLLIAPHNIFELPATWIAGAAGFKLPYELIQYFRDKKDYILNREELTEFLLLSSIAFLLVIIAAIVEVEVTTKIMDMIIG